jgi:hypothetical protein
MGVVIIVVAHDGTPTQSKGDSMSDTIKLRFAKWEQYNKRAKEYKNPIWFSFQNDFATNRNFHDFTDQQRLIFIYLLCEASQQNDAGNLTIELAHFAYHTRQKEKDIVACVKKLAEKQILETRDRTGIVAGSYRDRDLAVTEQNRTEQNKTEHNNTPTGSSDDSLSHPSELCDIVSILVERRVRGTVSRGWLEAFPDSRWLMGEVRKALAWESANPARRKKDFGRFMTNWLMKGWDSRRVPVSHSKANEAERREQANRASAEEALRLMGGES